MKKYDYTKAMQEDVRTWLEDNAVFYNNFADYDSHDALCDFLNDTLWDCDSVTGNGSGSYTFCTWDAEENICHNYDLLSEACNEFCCSIPTSAEVADVTIRCYLLGSVIEETVSNLEKLGLLNF